MTSGPKNRVNSGLILRLARREILHHKRLSLIFILTLATGIVGFMLLDAFRTSLSSYLDQKSQAMLAADLVVSAGRKFSEEELAQISKVLPAGSETRRELSTFSMAQFGGKSRLVELVAIDEKYPFYGGIVLGKAGALAPGAGAELTKSRSVWLYPELLSQLKGSLGAELKLGTQTFVMQDTITQDPTSAAAFATVAPKVIIGMNFLEDAGLTQKGARIRYAVLAALPKGADVDASVAALKKTFKASDVRIRGHRNASEDTSRLLTYMNDYLGLIAMVALFLAAIGVAYLFRSHMAAKRRDIAIMLALGMPATACRLLYATQLVIFSVVAAAIAALATWILVPVLPLFFQGLVQTEFAIQLSWTTVLFGLAVATLTSLLSCLPHLRQVGHVHPSELLQPGDRVGIHRADILLVLPGLITFYFLAVFQARSFIVGSLFAGLFVGGGLIAGLLCLAVLRVTSQPEGVFTLRQAILGLTRRPLATSSVILALSLCALLLTTVVQVRGLLLNEFRQEGGSLPSLFLFDIQEEQLEPLTQTLAARETKLLQVSPLIRALISAINDQPVRQQPQQEQNFATREDEESQRFMNRGHNLSYRAGLGPAETVVDSQPAKTDLPPISLEFRFADRLNVGLGDKLTFDVQGVPISGEVTQLRRVRWSSFLPNFFIQFMPGVLEDAPKIFIAVLPNLDADGRSATQDVIVEQFPNISVVDVTRVIERVTSLLNQLTIAITAMAALSTFAGLFVLYAIARHQADMQLRDFCLFKVLGARGPSLRKLTTIQYSVLGSFSALVGVGLGTVTAFVLSIFVFERATGLVWLEPVGIMILITGLTTLTGQLAARKVFAAKPMALLNS